jgi:ribosome recycling factor
MIDDIINVARASMQTALDTFESELKKISSSTVSTIEDLEVDFYGTPTPVSQVATVTVIDSLIVVKPYQATMIAVIAKAIRSLGVDPVVDSDLLRVPVPPLTFEQRKDLGKQVLQLAEQARGTVYAAQKDATGKLAAPEISAEDRTSATKQLATLTGGFIDSIDQLVRAKRQELES